MLGDLPRRIIYTRHPECLHNVDHQNALREGIKNRDSPLTPVGELQRDICADYLQREFPDITAAFCSTFSRTFTIPIAAGFESILTKTPLLDERNMGVWHTALREDVIAQYPGEEERLKEVGYYAYEAPGGESCASVEDRLSELLQSRILGDSNTVAYISGHGISGLCLRRLITGASLEDWHAWKTPRNASVSVFDFHENGYVCTMYDYVPWEGMIDPLLLNRKGTAA